MSKYTTEVRFICENGAGLVESEGYKSINQIITDAIPKIFDFEFPIFDETYRSVLERKILKHYYTREICAETVGLWKHYLDMRLNEIMPYYNKLYESELLAFNPFYDVDLTKDHTAQGKSDTEHERNDNETNTVTRTDNLATARNSERTDDLTRTDAFTRTDNLTTTRDSERTDDLTRTDAFTRTDNLKSTSQDSGTQGESGSDVNKNDHWDMYSDTPQGAITNVRNESYLTNARHVTDDGSGSTHSNTITFGKKVVVDDTGTQQNGGTSKNTGTQNIEETETNTGTQKNDGSKTLKSEFTTGVNTTEEYLEHVKGKTPGASYSKLLSEYRETFLNIDMMIIDALSDLFFGLW